MAWYDVYNYDPEEQKWAILRQAKERYKHLEPFKKPEPTQPGLGKQEQDEITAGTSLNDPAERDTSGNVYRIMEQMRNSDYLKKIDDDYVYNTHTLFKGLKMPNFGNVTKVKTQKPTPKQLANYAGMTGYTPLREGLKVYKYKTIDRETGESVIVPQKEITVYAENKDNYFYLQNGTLKSVAKDEVSPQSIDKSRLEGIYKYNINKKAEAVRKLPTPSSQQQFEPYEAGFMEKVKEAGKSVLGGFVYGLGESLSGATKTLADTMIAKGTGPYAHEDEYFGTYKMELDKKTGMLKDPEAYDKWIADREKMEKHAFPKGYSKETDTMAKTKDKVAIAMAREDDNKQYLANFLGKKPEDINAKEEYSKIAGNIAGTIGELIATGTLTKTISAPKYVKKAIEISVMAGKTGFLESLKNKENEAIDHLKAFARDAVFFSVGGKASKSVEAGLKKVAIPHILKAGAKSLSFGLAGSAASAPFVEEDARTDYIMQQTLIGTAFDAAIGGVMSTGKGVKKVGTKSLSKGLKKLFSTKLDTEIEKEVSKVVKEFGLDKDISKLTASERAKLEEETSRKLLAKVGKTVRDRFKESGSKAQFTPKNIVKFYKNKYKIDGKFHVSADLRGKGNVARAEIKGDKIFIKYNKNYSQDEIAGALRHEIEHVLDSKVGYISSSLKVENPRTLAQLLAKPGHHAKYNNFEIGYLENMIAKDAIENYISSPGSKDLRIRMAMEIGSLDTPLYLEDVHNRNRIMTDASNLPSYETPKKSMKTRIDDAFDRVYKDWVDRYIGITRTGEKAKMAVTNYGKYKGQMEYNITENLTDKAGKKIGNKSLKSVLQAPKGLQGEYESYLFHLHHLDRLKVEKPVLADAKGNPLTEKRTREIIEQYETQFPEFKKHKESLRQYWDDFMTEYAVDGDLATQESYDIMKKMYPEYVPTHRKIDRLPSTGGYGALKEVPIRKATGSSRELLPLAETMPMQMERVMRAQKRNRVYLSIVDQIITNPEGMSKFAQLDTSAAGEIDERIASLIKPEVLSDVLDNLDGQLVKSDKFGSYMIALDKGRPIKVKINDEGLWTALNKLNKVTTSRPEEILKLFNNAVTQSFKKVTTVYNPLFAVRNAARDTPTAYIYGKVDNPFKFMKNLAVAYSDTITKNNEYQRFVALGGPSSNITKADQQIKYKDAKGVFKMFDAVTRFVGKALNMAGEVSETAPRLAEFKNSYKKYIKEGVNELDALERAMFDAGEVTVNFARGGEVSKTVDMIVPYFNAGVQGTDRFIRAMFTDGVKKGNWKPIIKSLGLLTIPSMALHLVNKNINPMGYEDLPDYTKDDNYVFPIGSGTKFLKIPKNRESSLFFSTVFTRMYDFVVEGKEDAFKDFDSAVSRALGSPITDIISGGIFGPVTNLALGGNEDYFGRPIEPVGMRLKGSAKMDIYDERTSKLTVELGPYLEKIFNISPKQADYLIKSYGGIVGTLVTGWGYMGGSPLDQVEKVIGLTTDVKYGSKTQQRQFEELNEIKREINRIELDSGIKSIRDRPGLMRWEIDEAIENALGARMTRLQNLKARRKRLERMIKGLPPEEEEEY